MIQQIDRSTINLSTAGHIEERKEYRKDYSKSIRQATAHSERKGQQFHAQNFFLTQSRFLVLKASLKAFVPLLLLLIPCSFLLFSFLLSTMDSRCTSPFFLIRVLLWPLSESFASAQLRGHTFLPPFCSSHCKEFTSDQFSQSIAVD
mmetsp:Transcript_49669/g.97881  ORF Transcript_49669/g.97881 Transcript_49669/m.97881 type:complete len:147 (-) Transcript_49669:1223-1663(-)